MFIYPLTELSRTQQQTLINVKLKRAETLFNGSEKEQITSTFLATTLLCKSVLLMDGSSDCSTFGAKPVSPRSPPGSIDLYGKRTQMFKVQALEREIGLLQEELKSVEGLQPASRYCKEIDDFVGAKQDPLVTKAPKIHKSHPFQKRLRERNCIFPWVCCCFSCAFHLKMRSIFTCCISCKSKCLQCTCCSENTACPKCYKCEEHSCSTCSCCCFRRFFHKCKTVNSCCGRRKACCSSCCRKP